MLYPGRNHRVSYGILECSHIYVWIKFLVDNFTIFRYLKLEIAFAFIVSNEWKIKKNKDKQNLAHLHYII